MPIYDYICKECDHELEALQNFNEEPLITCPKCKKDGLKKRVTAPAFAFKGGGWYKDLYGSAKSDTSSSSKPAVASSPKVGEIPAKPAE